MAGGDIERLRARHRADNGEAAIIARGLLENDVRATVGKDVKIADSPSERCSQKHSTCAANFGEGGNSRYRGVVSAN